MTSAEISNTNTNTNTTSPWRDAITSKPPVGQPVLVRGSQGLKPGESWYHVLRWDGADWREDKEFVMLEDDVWGGYEPTGWMEIPQ